MCKYPFIAGFFVNISIKWYLFGCEFPWSLSAFYSAHKFFSFLCVFIYCAVVLLHQIQPELMFCIWFALINFCEKKRERERLVLDISLSWKQQAIKIKCLWWFRAKNHFHCLVCRFLCECVFMCVWCLNGGGERLRVQKLLTFTSSNAFKVFAVVAVVIRLIQLPQLTCKYTLTENEPIK